MRASWDARIARASASLRFIPPPASFSASTANWLCFKNRFMKNCDPRVRPICTRSCDISRRCCGWYNGWAGTTREIRRGASYVAGRAMGIIALGMEGPAQIDPDGNPDNDSSAEQAGDFTRAYCCSRMRSTWRIADKSTWSKRRRRVLFVALVRWPACCTAKAMERNGGCCARCARRNGLPARLLSELRRAR